MAKRHLLFGVSSCLLALLLAGCASEKKALQSAMASITAEDLKEDIARLSSDEFMGRFPATEGEEKTIQFLKDEFQKAGLSPGNGESYFQEVPMVEITADPSATLSIESGKETMRFQYAGEFVAVTQRVAEEVSFDDSDLVFVGYGIVAPEYNWNDYQELDVRGKTIVVLVNDPGYATKDPELFNGKAMTYYGRWTYKYEEAARQGAAGVFIIHETAPAAYGWGVVRNGWTGPQLNLVSEDKNLSRCAAEGWLHLDAARRILAKAGLDYDELKQTAARRGFKPIPLAMKASLTLKNTIRYQKSHNVIGLLPGSRRPDEYIIYMAHWDHFGVDPSLEGDQIFNGALDNATGTAALIELAEAFMMLKPLPPRSIVFLALTGEEQGLLGSQYYATNPVYPRTKTVAAVNMDSLNIWGKMRDITVIGYGISELDDYLKAAAAEQGRRVRPDPEPERGSFFRSDHFPFAKEGIPAVYPTSGIDHVEHGEEWTLAQREKYIAEKYHQPSDEYDPNWDLSGAIDDLHLLFRVGHMLSKEKTFPNWKEGTEFKAKRDAEMEAAQKIEKLKSLPYY